MSRSRWISAVACFAAAVCLQAPHARAAGSPAPKRPLTVFAAASLSDAFDEIGAALSKSQGIDVTFNFAGSQQLATQIEHGAAPDLFAAADMRWMDYLRLRGLIEAGDTVFCHNRLVVIVPKSNPARIKALPDLARAGVKVVLAAQAVPAGEYSRKCLNNLSHHPEFGDDYATRVLHNLASEEEDVKSVVSKVQLGEADAGMVYFSDVTPAVAKQVRVIEIPSHANVLASYPIVKLPHASHSAEADAFLGLLLSSDGQVILARNGLLPASPKPR